MALKLNPLSTSKGKKYSCELCASPASLACQHCRVTYYCTHEHLSTDWFGIHEKICQLLGALRTLRPTLGSEDERQRRNLTVQMSQHALIDLCKNEAQKHLVAGQYELAIPGALQSLRFSMEVYGAGRIELVPAYLLLAESNLGLKRYKVAEEFLLYANWSVLKNPDCSNELKSQLYRNFGKLYASQGRLEAALKQLANDVYYSSLESGPEHIDTAGGYFYMADVFLTRNEIENALAFYDKVVDIWYKFLVNLRHRPDENISDYLSEAHIGEAVEMLRTIVDTRKKHRGSTHIATGEGMYTLGILKHVTGYDSEARSLYKKALAIYKRHLGEDNESTLAIVRALGELPSADDGEDDEGEDGKDASPSKPLALEAPSPAPHSAADAKSKAGAAAASAANGAKDSNALHDRNSSLDAKTAGAGRETPQKALRPASRNAGAAAAGSDNGSAPAAAAGSDRPQPGQPATAPALSGALQALTDLHAAENAGKAGGGSGGGGGGGKAAEQKELEEKQSKQTEKASTPSSAGKTAAKTLPRVIAPAKATAKPKVKAAPGRR